MQRDYIKGFEDRLGVEVDDYIFVQVQSGMTKRIRDDFHITNKDNPLLSDAGLTSNVEIHAFQKLQKRDLKTVKDQNRREYKSGLSKYFDYYDESEVNIQRCRTGGCTHVLFKKWIRRTPCS